MNLKINSFNLSYYVYILDVVLWSYHQLKTGCQNQVYEHFLPTTVLPTATVRHRVDPSNIFFKVLRYWQTLYICKQVCIDFAQIEEL
jgi:hypothetical protein